MDLIKDVWDLLKTRKKFWLLPAIIVLIAVGAILIFGGGTAIAPLIYTIF